MAFDSDRAFMNHLARSVHREIANAKKAIVEKGMFWFVDIPRTSSTSLRVCLGESVGYPHGKENTLGQHSYNQPGPVESPLIGKHVPVFLMRHLLGSDIWDCCFRFSMVRQPHEWLYSLFMFTRRYRSLGYKSTTFDGFLWEFMDSLRQPLFKRVSPGRMLQSEYLMRDGLLDVNLVADYNCRSSLISHLGSLLSLNLNRELTLMKGWDRDDYYSTNNVITYAWSSIHDQDLLRAIEGVLEPDLALYMRCHLAPNGLLSLDNASVPHSFL